MPIWQSRKTEFTTGLARSQAHLNRGEFISSGFASGSVTTDAGLDILGVASLGYGAVRAAPRLFNLAKTGTSSMMRSFGLATEFKEIEVVTAASSEAAGYVQGNAGKINGSLTPAYDSKTRCKYIFRGTETKPEIVFEQGFNRSGNLNLQMHMEANESSGFISTSKSPNIARGDEFVSAGDYVYVIKHQEHGLDVNAVLGKASKYPYEHEIAVPKSISHNDIKGARMIDGENEFIGQFIKNPNYKH